jgi:hypothetical protein
MTVSNGSSVRSEYSYKNLFSKTGCGPSSTNPAQ